MGDTGEDLERRIGLTGWSSIILGLVCLMTAGLQWALPILLRRFAEVLDTADDPLRGMRESLAAGAGTGALVNGAFGIALLIIGWGVVRRTRWSHPALEVTCWASIGVLALLAKPTLAPLFALGKGDWNSGAGLIVLTVVLMLLQIAAVIWFLRFWRKPEVRAAFR